MNDISNSAFNGRNAVVVVHGGAGAVSRSKVTKARERQARAKLEQALKAGYAAIEAGGASLDAVIATVKVLEDTSLYNAGRGSCLTRAGRIEMDAAVMEGTTLKAGAVAGLNCVKNPVTAARAVMDYTSHVFLAGPGANSFARKIAKQAGLSIVDPAYFRTARAEHNLKLFLKKEKEARRGPSISVLTSQAGTSDPPGEKYGTVGAVAVDRFGHLSSATSTGGTAGKDPGRVGDSPSIGAGTFADNQTCALSATGHGEHFMRAVVGHEASSLIRYLGFSVDQAAERIMSVTLPRTRGDGGIILLNSAGDYSMRFSTLCMFRGVIFEDGSLLTAIWDN